MITKVAAWPQSFLTSASSQKQEEGLGFGPLQLSLSSSRLSALLSEVSSESSSDAVRLMRGCKSFMWRSILSTRNDSRLIIFVTQLWSNFMPGPTCNLQFGKSCTQDLETSSGCQLLLPLIHIGESFKWTQSGGGFIVFGCNIVPIDRFLDGTVHTGQNSFRSAVITLCYTIPSWGMHAMEPQMNTSLICKSSEFSAAEGWVSVRKELLGWTPLEEHHLQLAIHDHRVLSCQLFSNWEMQQANQLA